MGMTSVKLRVMNLSDRNRGYSGDFLVDSGATYTVLPTDELKKLGIEPEREEQFSLADGRIIKRMLGNALFEYNGIVGASPVMFGEMDDTPLLGAYTLESLGLNFDPLKRAIYKAQLRM